MLTVSIKVVFGGFVTAALVAAGVHGAAPGPAEPAYPTGPVTMTAGANPGGGFDLTIRSVVEALEAEHIVSVPLPIENRPGASGGDFLATMVEQYRGRDDQVSVTSLAMMMNQLRGTSPYGYGDVTMIARIMTEYFVVVDAPGSSFADLNDVMAAITTDPARVRVGAASDDQIPFDLLVSAAGGDPSTVNYVYLEGGADQTAALLDGRIDVAIGGLSEFVDQVTSGQLDTLGVLAEEPVPGLAAPTAREQGLDVTLANWRGLYGPPDMPDYAVTYWQQALETMAQSPTWLQIAERNRFTTTFMIGDELQAFLAETQADVAAAL